MLDPRIAMSEPFLYDVLHISRYASVRDIATGTDSNLFCPDMNSSISVMRTSEDCFGKGFSFARGFEPQ